MRSLKFFYILILMQFLYITYADSKQEWTYEILEFKSQTSNTDWIDLEYKLERIGRGKFGISGFLHIKQDVYDDYTVGINLERSSYRTGPFMRHPMSVDNITLTEAMNTLYKDILMDTLQNCSVNAPFFEDKFEAPLTARMVEVSKCILSTENLPSILMAGYYKLRTGFYGKNNGYVESLTLVETTK
ncbi:uncharacterized protein LOC111686550 isoform X2 [Lucilia cuprina]|uniref:uncharacterized protein LOC111686550 isoform X2 n=1 Tax=Lucilia cuprina TaxID=7375 RepID=UPI001F0664AE|nr:uncharacterized protein LOC111686550 isoform X2 [Lucilia cuprina]